MTPEDELVEKAKKLIEALKEQPDDLALMIAIGDTFARAGRDDQARQYYQMAYTASGGSDYRIKVKMDELLIRQFRRELRAFDTRIYENPNDQEAAKGRNELIEKKNAVELEIFSERSDKYPTDMILRFELGLRQYRGNRIKEAIGSFELSSRDPKNKVQSLNMLGKCFFALKLYREAAVQFQAGMEAHGIMGDDMWKELRHNLGLAKDNME